MLTAAVILLSFVAVLAVAGLIILRKRIETGAKAKAAWKAAAAARLAEGRLRGELDYVLARIDRNLEAPEASGVSTPEWTARLRELRDVLRQTMIARKDSFPISGPCADVIEEFRSTAGERDLLYTESGDGRWLHVQADRTLVRWAIREIFANVHHHAGDWSRVSLLAEPVEGAIVLTVRDDGQGVDQPTSARIYSPFTPRLRSPGPGLGLYAVRMIVEHLGGTVEGHGALGQGVVHRLRLPHPPSGPYGGVSGTPHHAVAPRAAHNQ